MMYSFVSQSGSSRLIIIFAGWGMDDNPFKGLYLQGYDIVVVWDYTSESTELPFWNGYSELCVLAWSYGVYFAGRFIELHPELPVTARVAVNGTLYPIDKEKGISPEIFDATLQALSAQSITKFNRRMCGNPDVYERFIDSASDRTLDSLRGELAAIKDKYMASGTPGCDWDIAYISQNDRIIPAAAQYSAWNVSVRIVEIPGGSHYPDFSKLLNDSFIHKDGVSDAFTRSLSTYDSNASAQRSVAEYLFCLIKNRLPVEGDVIEIGCGSGFLTKLIEPVLGNESHLTLVDVSPIDVALPGSHINGDAEIFIHSLQENSLSAIVSSSAVQWFNSPVSFIKKTLRVLKPGGILALAVYDETTFREIPELKSPSRAFSMDLLKSIVPSEYAIDVCEKKEYIQQFDSPLELLRHFRLTGVAPKDGSAESTIVARTILRNNVKTLSYNPIFLLLTKKKNCNFVG